MKLLNIFEYFAVMMLGLSVGSFLNVIIYRFPLMLQEKWRQDCCEFLQITRKNLSIPLNLFYPRPHCPKCKFVISFWKMIPIISYIYLKGKCSNCQQSISVHYPFVEFFTSILSIFIFAYFGNTWQTPAAWIFSWSLLVLFFIDIEYQILPDEINLSLLWLGLFLNLFNLFTPISDAVLGAIVGYSMLWAIASLYRWLRNKEGIGYGDFKFLAMIGAWLGLSKLLWIVAMGSVLGILAGLIAWQQKTCTLHSYLPYAPYLATAAWMVLFYQKSLEVMLC